MELYNDGYDEGDPQLNMLIQSAEWIHNQTKNLFEQYKNCQTEHCRKEILRKISSVRRKMNYEGKILKNIIDKAKEDGII